MDLNEIAIFVKVAQAGSFTGAARQLGMPNSTVSAKVAALEKRLGVTLIRRTTRKLHLTLMGQVFLERSLMGLRELQAAENSVVATQQEPQGLLKITAPVELGGVSLPELISRYLKRYPKMNVEVQLSDQVKDLIAEGIDLAIRIGPLKDSSLMAKKLGEFYFAIYGSPRYLKIHKAPKRPDDLKKHACLQFAPLGSEEWNLIGPKTRAKVSMPQRVVVNDLSLIKSLTLAGEGLALIPYFYCDHEEKSGKLVRVLPDWQTTTTPVHFIYPPQKFIQPGLSAFIEMATPVMRSRLSTDSVPS